MTTRAIGYVRLSVHKGEDDPSTSPQRQRDEIEALASRNGWSLVDVLSDLDESGSEHGRRLERPGLAAAIAAIHAGDADVLVVARLDRLARSTRDFLTVTEQVPVASAKEEIDTSGAHGRFQAQLLAGLAELESGIISERVSSGVKAARK